MSVELPELKEWLSIDYEDEDINLSSLISASELLIEQSTGVIYSDVENDDNAKELYKTLQKFIIGDLYKNRTNAGKISPALLSLYAQLEAYKLQDTQT